MPESGRGLTTGQAALKRSFDIGVAIIGLALTFWIIAIAWLAAALDTGANGFFMQERIGRHGKRFNIIKIRTMRVDPSVSTNVTTARDSRITPTGHLLRSAKIDELPQLINVLLGHMSLVGPRPDVPGFADNLTDEDRIILKVRPGITGPATLHYRKEQDLLARVEHPETYNREVIFPEKVRINRHYVENWSFLTDLKLIARTLFP